VPEAGRLAPRRFKDANRFLRHAPVCVPTLKHLLAQSDFEVVAVITQPDRPRARPGSFFFAVKEAALAAKLPVHQPEKIRAPEVQELLQGLAPDCIVIIAYGQIIRQDYYRFRNWAGLICMLPCSPNTEVRPPINWAIVNGETRTGVTTMRIDAGMVLGRCWCSGGSRSTQKRQHQNSLRACPNLAHRSWLRLCADWPLELLLRKRRTRGS